MMRRTHVPISDLASFAVDPDGYRARNGGPVSAPAAAYGRSYHGEFGRSKRARSSWAFAVAVVVALLILVFGYLSIP